MLKIDENNNIARVTLSRPEVRNAFHPELIESLSKNFKKFSTMKNLRAVVLEGEGKVFCAGADLNWMSEMVNYTKAQNKKDSEVLFNMFETIWKCPVPIIARAQGAAFGGAIGLLACSDVVVATSDLQLCFSEVKLGIAPAVISHFVLQKVSVGQATPWMLSGEIFGADHAQRMGLVHRVCSGNELDAKVDEWTLAFSKAGPQAVRATKQLLRAQLRKSAAKKYTTDLIARLRVSDEGHDGLSSFLEKRTPSWIK